MLMLTPMQFSGPFHARMLAVTPIEPIRKGNKYYRVARAANNSRRGMMLTPTTVASSERPDTDTSMSSTIARFIVNAMTEGLRALSTLAPSTGSTVPTTLPTTTKSRCREMNDLINALRADYEERNYFVTGVLTDELYDKDCFFADPTISFTGLDLWKRNLQLLVPFLVTPSIHLLSLGVMEGGTSSSSRTSRRRVRGEWVLRCGLRLPWRPSIVVQGATEYWVEEEEGHGRGGGLKIVEHVESWDVDGWQAVRMVFTPSLFMRDLG